MTHIGRMRRMPSAEPIKTVAEHRAEVSLARAIFGIPQDTEVILSEPHGFWWSLLGNLLDVSIVMPGGIEMKPILCPQCSLSPAAATQKGCCCKFTRGHAAGFAEALEMAALKLEAKAQLSDDRAQRHSDRAENDACVGAMTAAAAYRSGASAIRSLATAPTGEKEG